MEVFILVISFIILLGIGLPIAWSIGLNSLFTMLVSIPILSTFTTIAQRMATGLDSFSLLAILFFILAGQIMNLRGADYICPNCGRYVQGGMNSNFLINHLSHLYSFEF